MISKETLDMLIRDLHVQPVGNGYIDCICPMENASVFIDEMTSHSVKIIGFTWFCYVTGDHKPCGMGGSQNKYGKGWYSEIEFGNVKEFSSNTEVKKFLTEYWSVSPLSCVLADNALDFLRLLSIGYDEICWDEDFPYPPNERPDNDFFVKPNAEFVNWVETTFKTSIPKTALEIVKHPANMEDESSEDEFFNWISKFE